MVNRADEAQIISFFNDFLISLNTLSSHIQKKLSDCPTLISLDKETFLNDTEQVIYSIKSISKDPLLKAQETPSFPGAVACKEETIELIDELNLKKDLLRTQFEQYKQNSRSNPTKQIREILKKNGYGPINLKQVYRHIHYVKYHPTRIAWAKSKTLSNVTLSNQEAEEMLLRAGSGPNIEIQLNKLRRLPKSVKLIKQRKIKPRHEVNVSRKNAEDKIERENIRTTLPLFYLLDENKPSPIVCFSKPSTTSKGGRATRSDKRLEDAAFLPSISVYLYQEKFR